jgi:GNAT superfamily N-acetyltransferase
MDPSTTTSAHNVEFIPTSVARHAATAYTSNWRKGQTVRTAPVDVEVRHTTMDHALAAPMFVQLAEEYYLRYGDASELRRYPAIEFARPHGALLLLLEHGRPVAGGAFRRHDPATAEIKRMWTHSAHRRRGLGLRVLAELEAEATARGYCRLYLTTGWRQPEAAALYRGAGYTSLSERIDDATGVRQLAFEKHLTRERSGSPWPPRRSGGTRPRWSSAG